MAWFHHGEAEAAFAISDGGVRSTTSRPPPAVPAHVVPRRGGELR